MKKRGGYLNALSIKPLWGVESVAKAGILLSAFLVIVYCFWTLDRGFDITDESYYVLLAMHAGSVKFYISAQQWITAGIWNVTGSITMFRAAGMALLLSSSALLAGGVLSACLRLGMVADSYKYKGVVMAGSAIGALLYASTINLSPCYNLLASSGAYAAAGMVLLASNRSSIVHKYALFALAGCSVGAEALCKPSAGIATLALLACWGVIFERSLFDKIFGFAVMASGAVTFAGIVLLVNTTISDATQSFEQGMQLFRIVQVESIGARLVRYLLEYGKYFWAALRAFAIPLVAMLVYVTTRRTLFAQCGLAALVIILIFGSLDLDTGAATFSMGNADFNSFLFGGFERYKRQNVQLVALFSMLVMALMVTIPVWGKNRSALTLFVGLLLLPYAVAIGTGNTMFSQVIVSLAPWGTLVSVLVVACVPANLNKMPMSLIGFCFITTIALQILTSSLRPYHLSLSLLQQNQTTVIGDLGKVKVDSDTYNFISGIKSACDECGIAPGAPFFGMYNIPGVALALQAVPVVTPWINNREQAEFIIDRMDPDDAHSAVVALKMMDYSDTPSLPHQLAAFPSGFRYCGMAMYPYKNQSIQIWQSQIR